MSSIDLFNTIRSIAARPSLMIATVLDVNDDNTSTVQFPDGSTVRVRGTSVAVGAAAFVRNGIVEGIAPSREAIVIEI